MKEDLGGKITASDFSIIRGGLMDRFLSLVRITKPGSDAVLRKVVFFITLSWVPLALLSAFEGFFWNTALDVPFYKEFATHIRFFLAIPLLVLSEGIVDKRVNASLNQFTKTGVISGPGKEKFNQAKAKADRMCESYWAEGIILAYILFNLLFRINTTSVQVSTWIFPYPQDPNALSYAGYWAAFISFPLFQFLVFRWFWRWIIWFRLLFLIAHADLQLLPTHPDRSGGLGFLGEAPLPFGVFTFVMSIVFSAMLAERVLFQDFVLQDHYALVAAFILFCIAINMAPLLAFTKPLSLARQKGLSRYHALVSNHHRDFENKWLDKENRQKENLLGHPDASSAADLSTVYTLAESMTIVPFNIKTMAITIVVSLTPIAAVFALQLPVAQLVKMLAGFLL